MLRHANLPEPIDLAVDVWGQTREEWFGRHSR
jgi:hypothetical protein